MFCTRCGKTNTNTSQFCFNCGQALTPGATTGARPYAGFWARWAALFIDSIVLGIITIIGAIAFAVLGFAGGQEDGALIAGVAGYYIISIVGSWLYFALMESSSYQGTLGKRAVGAMVTDEAGQRISFGRATGRFFGKILSQLTLGIGFLMAAFTAQKRGLHDFVAGTLVVNRDPSRSSVAVVAIVFAALSVPMVGIIAAIAIPGLLRARIAGNEQSAIGSMRSIASAQLSYFSKCGGYAPSLKTLATDDLLPSEFTTGDVVARSGYQISMTVAAGGTAVENPEPGCEGAVSNYFAQAAPITAGSTGNRFFATDERSTIFEDTSDAFRSPQPLD
jgi:uncharacterized RDD family membrane protein YckC/type II secretory pathway pseudopilin PulG